ELSKMLGNDVAPVVYAALPPVLFGGVARGIADALPAATRLVVEKPFGHDVASAVALHDEITSLMPASQVFAVDHFLAKAEVEHLAPFRYRNPLIDAAFDQSSVDRIEVIMAEAFGVDGRGSFYESVGALRDVVQNHLLQMIAVVLMEAPTDDSAKAFDRARANLLADMRPLTPADVVLGQFDGYRDLDDVADDSIVETFVAARLAVDNTRWRGVPITLRTGKELADSVTSIEIHLGENTVRFGIKPERIVVLRLDVDGERTDLVACAPTGHPADEAGDHRGAKRGEVILGDYATMLAGAIDGDQRHFAQIADIVRAWEIVEGVLDSGGDPSRTSPAHGDLRRLERCWTSRRAETRSSVVQLAVGPAAVVPDRFAPAIHDDSAGLLRSVADAEDSHDRVAILELGLELTKRIEFLTLLEEADDLPGEAVAVEIDLIGVVGAVEHLDVEAVRAEHVDDVVAAPAPGRCRRPRRSGMGC
ncbi:MAG: hypothetical protein R2710_17875, partial [Acidimicrobiales bacterium]